MRRFLTFPLVVLAIVASPLAAASEPNLGNAEARRALTTLGQCLNNVRANDIQAYLASPSQDTWYPVTHVRNDEAPCVGLYTVEAELSVMRGAVAEAWYLAEFPTGPASFSGATNVAPSQIETAALIVAADEAERPQVIADEFARCVAMVAPLGVDALLRTPVSTKAEMAAISALSPHFSPCAFEGQKLAFNAETLRASLAFALAGRVAKQGRAR